MRELELERLRAQLRNKFKANELKAWNTINNLANVCFLSGNRTAEVSEPVREFEPGDASRDLSFDKNGRFCRKEQRGIVGHCTGFVEVVFSSFSHDELSEEVCHMLYAVWQAHYRKVRFRIVCASSNGCNLTPQVFRWLEQLDVSRMVDRDILMQIWKNRVGSHNGQGVPAPIDSRRSLSKNTLTSADVKRMAFRNKGM
ncbi:hypothetical protein TNCV_1677951 [Trichonephila clavipes]|nr:hypothetical protein TNCV_1677951 [Trichonephila clavipes]